MQVVAGDASLLHHSFGVNVRSSSPRFARAYELLRRREEMKLAPDPFPPVQAPRPLMASATTSPDLHAIAPEPRATAPVAAAAILQPAPSRTTMPVANPNVEDRLHLEEVHEHSDEIDDFSEASTPGSKALRPPTPPAPEETGVGRNTNRGAARRRSPFRADTALGRLALDEGLTSDSSATTGSRRGQKRQVVPRRNKPLDSRPLSSSARGDALTARRPAASEDGETNTVASESREPSPSSQASTRRKLANFVAARDNRATRLARSPPQRQVAQVAVAHELDDMQRRYRAALGEIGRLKEIRVAAEKEHAKRDERPPATITSGGRRRVDIAHAASSSGADSDGQMRGASNQSPVTRLVGKRGAFRVGGSSGGPPVAAEDTPLGSAAVPARFQSSVVPRYRDPTTRHRPATAMSTSPPSRKPPLPTAARGPPVTAREVAAAAPPPQSVFPSERNPTPTARGIRVGATTSGTSPSPPRRPRSVAPKDRDVKRQAGVTPKPAPRDGSSSPPKPRDPDYVVARYDYSKRLLAAHEALRRQRLQEIKASTVVSTSAAGAFARSTADCVFESAAPAAGTAAGTPAARAAKSPGNSRSASQASTTGSAIKKPQRIWSPAPSRVDSISAAAGGGASSVPHPSERSVRIDVAYTRGSSGQRGPATSTAANRPLNDAAEAVRKLLTSPVHRLRHELGSDFVDLQKPLSWLKLALFANHDAITSSVIVPLLLSQLQASPADSVREQLLCALIGLGHTASAGFQVFMDMLLTSSGDKKLVALAVRSCCGQPGVDALLKLLDSTTATASCQATAAYALGLLPECDRTPGHTTVLCADLNGPSSRPRRRESISLIRVGNAEGPAEEAPPLTVRAKKPKYVPTHVVVDAQVLLRLLQQYFASPQAGTAAVGLYRGIRRAAATFIKASTCIPHLTGEQTASIAQLGEAVVALEDGVDRKPAELQGGFAPSDAIGDRIMATVMRYLSTHDAGVVSEQLLLALAAMPSGWAAPYLTALLGLASGRLAATEATLAAAAQCLGSCMSHKHRKSTAEAAQQQDAVALLARLIATSGSTSVIIGALAGCRIAGATASAAAPVAFERWMSTEVPEVAEAAVACLAALGHDGLVKLIAVAEDASYHVATRQLAVTGLVASCSAGSTSASPTNVVRCIEAIVTSEKGNDVLLSTCVPALARIVLKPKAIPLHANEDATAVAVKAPQLPKLDTFVAIMEGESEYQIGSRFAAAEALAVYAGAVGTALLEQMLLKHARPSVRTLAANVLIHAGGSPVVALMQASNDVSDDVREEAVESLRRIGVATVVQTLRGPQRGRLALAHRCCTDLLRSQYDPFIDAVRDELALDLVELVGPTRAAATAAAAPEVTPTASSLSVASTSATSGTYPALDLDR